ncbi:MAG: efflux RND transporter periplasmic adaptor subunit [Gemmataceae bacterium]
MNAWRAPPSFHFGFPSSSSSLSGWEPADGRGNIRGLTRKAKSPGRKRPPASLSRPNKRFLVPPSSKPSIPTGKTERVVTQPGSVHAYQVVHVYAKASGFLKTQNVDIGSKVKKGDVLAIVDIPELTQSLAKARAVLAQAEARVEQMKSRDKSAIAEHEAALAGIAQAEANEKSASAMLRYRNRQHTRLKELFDSRSIDERLVDESKQQFEAAAEAERAATANIATSKAQAAAKQAKILEAHADVLEAKAGVEVARAEAQRLQVQVDFATIAAPFDGVVTARNMFPGDYVRAANESGGQALFVLQRVDRMRVDCEIPDRDVPYADVGDPALVELDALPTRSFPAKVSRLAESEDPQTRLMSLEIDVANPDGIIRQGMFGRVRIVLDPQASVLSILPLAWWVDLRGRRPRMSFAKARRN